MIRLHLLGTVRLLDGDGRDIRAVLQQPKRLALLAFLAAARPHGAKRRDTLTGMFWGESDDASARRSLSQAIYFLRQKVHPDLFAGRFAEEIDLRAGEVWCDVVEFETALDEGRTADALALYTGEFMPGFHISEAPEWEKWLDTERDRLRKRASDAAWALAGTDEQAGRPGMAAHWARWAAALTPFDEQAHRKVLELLVRTGDRAGALRTHEEFARRLATEYEIEPSAETSALVEAIRRDVGGGETDAMVEKAAQGLRRDAGRSPDRSAGSETSGRETAGAESPTTAAAREGLAAASAGTNPAPADHTSVAVLGGAHGTEDASESRAVFRSTRRRGGKRMTPARGAIAIVVAVALLSVGYFVFRDASPPAAPLALAPEQPLDRIAILPFRDVSEGGQLGHVADGLAATLTDRLTDVERLSIVSPSTTAQFASVTFDSIGRALNVGALVGASLTSSGDRYRVHVELIDARTGTTLATNSLEQARGDLFALLDSMATSVEWMLREELGQQIELRDHQRETESQRAWELVQMAREMRELSSGAGDDPRVSLEASLRYLDEAIRLDPGYVRAWVERSRTFHAMALRRPVEGTAMLDSAEAASDHAIAIDEHNAEALEQRASVRFVGWIFNPDAAERLLDAEIDAKDALAIDPYRPRSESILSQIAWQRGDFRSAYEAALRAYRADAYAANAEDVLLRLFDTSFELGNDDEAAKWCDELRRRAPQSWLQYRCELMLLAFGNSGQPDMRKSLLALDAARRVRYVSENPAIEAWFVAMVGASYARAEMPDSAQALAERALRQAAGSPTVVPTAASTLLRIGMRERALELLREHLEALPTSRERLLNSRAFELLDAEARAMIAAAPR